MDRRLGAGLVSLLALGAAAPEALAKQVVSVAPSALEVVERDSGPVNYYTIVNSPDGDYLHSAYRPPYKTAVLGWAVPEELRKNVAKVRWRWRAAVLPIGGDECAKGKGDSAAVVYLTWKRGLRWYSLKYVWSAVGQVGAVCDRKRNPFVAQDTVILESGGPLNEWRTVELDPDAEFRKHFAKGDPEAKVPDFGGIGVMSDGDHTQSLSEADFSGFTLELR